MSVTERPRTTRARTHVTRRAAARRGARPRLDPGLSGPITGRRRFVAARMLAMLVAGAVVAFSFDSPHTTGVVAVLVATAGLQPLLPFLPPRTAVAQFQAVTDLVAVGGVLLLVPSLWPMLLIWVTTTIVWHALSSPVAVSAPITIAASLVVGITGAVQSIEHWPLAVVTLVLSWVPLTAYGGMLRADIWENESALMDALSAAGAVVHHSSLDTGTVLRTAGDLHAITGWSADEWCSVDHRQFLHPDDVDAYWVDVDRTEPNTVLDRVARMRHKDGSWVWIRDVALVTEDHRGRRTLRGFSLDVSEIERAHETIIDQLRVDALTGLPNRIALIERIADLIETGDHVAVMITDLDRFKEINDTLGHEAGDHLLTVVADRLRSAAGADDLVARMGGDEYAIVIPGAATADDVADLANRIAAECARPISVSGVDLVIAASTGVALRSSSGDDRATLIRHADIAMYAAKRDASGYRVFDSSLEQTSTMRFELSASIADSIERGELVAHFQPKFDMISRRLVGAEGLARWNHPGFGLLGPSSFLDLVLMSESCVPFALTMLEQAAELITATATVGHPMPIAVNVAMRALRDPDFGTAAVKILEHHGVAPELLVLELTETDALLPNQETLPGLRPLMQAGVQVSIDDFGTGHSSLERLRSLDVDELKIDRSFVSGMVGDRLQLQLVRTIVDLARGLGIRVVAEGVEREDQVALLVDMGCHTGQGFLFAAPGSAEAFMAQVRAQADAPARG